MDFVKVLKLLREKIPEPSFKRRSITLDPESDEICLRIVEEQEGIRHVFLEEDYEKSEEELVEGFVNILNH